MPVNNTGGKTHGHPVVAPPKRKHHRAPANNTHVEGILPGTIHTKCHYEPITGNIRTNEVYVIQDLLYLPQSLPSSIGKDMVFQLLHFQRNPFTIFKSYTPQRDAPTEDTSGNNRLSHKIDVMQVLFVLLHITPTMLLHQDMEILVMLHTIPIIVLRLHL